MKQTARATMALLLCLFLLPQTKAHDVWVQATRADALDDVPPFPPLDQDSLGGGLSLEVTPDNSLSLTFSQGEGGTDEWSVAWSYRADPWGLGISFGQLDESVSRTWQQGQDHARLDQTRDEQNLRIRISRSWQHQDQFLDGSLSLAHSESDTTRQAAVWREHPVLGRIPLMAGRETARFEDWTLDLDLTAGTYFYGESWALSPWLGAGWSMGLSEQSEGTTEGFRRLSLKRIRAGRAESAFESTPDTGYITAGVTLYPGEHWNLDLSWSRTVGGDEARPVTTLTLGYFWE